MLTANSLSWLLIKNRLHQTLMWEITFNDFFCFNTGERQTLPKTRQTSDHSGVSDDEGKQFLRPRWTENSTTNKLTIEMPEVKTELHEKEEKILQQQNIDLHRPSSPAILDIRLSTGLCQHDQSTAASTKSSPLKSGNSLRNKDPKNAGLKCRHLS